VNPAPYTRAIAEAAVQLGARVIHAEVHDLVHAHGCVSAVAVAGEQLACRGVVIACGPWCAEPSVWLGMPLPVEPVKGELLLAQVDTQGAPGAEITWRQHGVYFASESHMWLGGTEERVGYSSEPTASARESILAGIRELLPGLGEIRVIAHSTGLRPVSADGLPILGVPPNFENVCVALGGGRKGMLLGAGLGCAAAEMLVHGHTRLAVDACAPRNM
jgi:glycine oxidase